jgi:hypothetical protein
MSLTARLKGAASALSFAHLAGIGRTGPSGSVRAADKDPDEDAPPDAEDQDGDGKGKKGKKAKGADDGDDKYADDDADAQADDDDPQAAEGDGDDDEDTGPSRDDDEEEMRGNSPAAKARRRERARCAAIFARPEAARNPVLAASLAFKTTMTRRQAIAVLRDTPAPAAASPVARSRRNPDLGIAGEGGGQSAKRASQDRMVGFMKQATGRK